MQIAPSSTVTYVISLCPCLAAMQWNEDAADWLQRLYDVRTLLAMAVESQVCVELAQASVKTFTRVTVSCCM